MSHPRAIPNQWKIDFPHPELRSHAPNVGSIEALVLELTKVEEAMHSLAYLLANVDVADADDSRNVGHAYMLGFLIRSVRNVILYLEEHKSHTLASEAL